MKVLRVVSAAMMLFVGFACVAGLYWALLNVPESSVPAIGLSAALALCTVALAGITLGTAAAVSDDCTANAAIRRGLRALPVFVIALLLAVLLWWGANAVDATWSAHAGEVDALAIRYLDATRTAWLHASVAWLTWAVRWVLTPSVVISLTTAGSVDGLRSTARGLHTAVRIVPLASVAVAAAIVFGGLGTFVDWKPRGLPPTWMEAAFLSGKLLAVYIATTLIVAILLRIHRRAARGASAT